MAERVLHAGVQSDPSQARSEPRGKVAQVRLRLLLGVIHMLWVKGLGVGAVLLLLLLLVLVLLVMLLTGRQGLLIKLWVQPTN